MNGFVSFPGCTGYEAFLSVEVEVVPQRNLDDDVPLGAHPQAAAEAFPVVVAPLIQVVFAIAQFPIREYPDQSRHLAGIVQALLEDISQVIASRRLQVVIDGLLVLDEEWRVPFVAAEQHHGLALVLPVTRVFRIGSYAIVLDVLAPTGMAGRQKKNCAAETDGAVHLRNLLRTPLISRIRFEAPKRLGLPWSL